MAVPNQALADQFAARMAAGDYSGAAALGRGAGYADSQIAEYVGNMGTFKAADGATITQQTARDALGGLSTQNYGSGGLLNGQPNAEQQAFFAGRMGAGDFRGAEQYGNSLGFSQSQLADYVGAQGVRDNTGRALSTADANNYMNSTQNELNPRFATPAVPTGTGTGAGTGTGTGAGAGVGTTTGVAGGGTTAPSTPTSTAYTAPAAPAPAMAAPQMRAYERNPYLDQMAQGIIRQTNDNWTRNLAPSIRSGAMAAGGFGGSRQGVVEANGLNDLNRNLTDSLSNLYGNDYTQDRQRALQQYSADQGFALGQGNLGLGYAGLNNQFNIASMGNDTTRRGQDQSFTLGQGNLALGNRQADNSFALGQGNLLLGNRTLDSNNINTNRQIDNNFNIASRTLDSNNINTNRQIDNNWNIAQGNLGLNYAQLDNNIYNNNFNNSLNAANFGLNAYNTMNNQTGAGINAGTTINGVPQQNQQYFNNQYQAYGGQGGNTNSNGTQGTSSNGFMQGAGMGMMGANLGMGGSGFSGINPYNINLPTRGGQ